MKILHSQIIGQGKPLLILHGFLGMSDNWKTMGLKFSEQGFEVHLIDARNHGHSFHSDSFSYPEMAQDLLTYIEYHHIEQCFLMGHSMGGKTAMLFATNYATKVEKLVVIDISPKYYPIHHQLIIDGLASVDFQRHRTRGQIENQLAHYISDLNVRQFLLKNVYWIDKQTLGFRFNLPSLKTNLSEIGKALPSENQFKGKTLFIAGEKSSYIKNEDIVLIEKHFPNALVQTINNAGHWVQAEKPTEFFNTVLNFLS